MWEIGNGMECMPKWKRCNCDNSRILYRHNLKRLSSWWQAISTSRVDVSSINFFLLGQLWKTLWLLLHVPLTAHRLGFHLARPCLSITYWFECPSPIRSKLNLISAFPPGSG